MNGRENMQSPVGRELNLEDYAAILRRRWWVLAAAAVSGFAAGYLISLVVPSRYTSHTMVLVEQPAVPDSYVKPVLTEDLNQRLASMQEQILSRTRLQHLIEQFGLYRNDGKPATMDDLVERLRKSITVTPLNPMAGTRSEELPGFYVDVTMGEAQLAQKICTEITSMFMEQSSRLRQQHAEETTQFLARQLDDAKAKLDEQDAKLAEFQRHHLGELPEDETTNLTLLGGMTPQLEAASQALHQAQEDKAFTESLLSQQAAWQASKGGPSSRSLELQLKDLQDQLVSKQGHYSDDHPDVVKLKNDIALIEKKLADARHAPAKTNDEPARAAADEPPEIQQFRARLHQIDLTIAQRMHEQQELQRQIKVLQSKVQSSPLVQQEFKALTRDHQTALDFYNDLLKKRNESQMATELERRQQGEQFRVLDPPSLPQQPSFPKRTHFALGGLAAGLLLGLGWVRWAEWRDRSIRTKRDIEIYLGLPTLALIPLFESSGGAKKPSSTLTAETKRKAFSLGAPSLKSRR